MLNTLINKHPSRALLAMLLIAFLSSCGGGGVSGLLPLKITLAEVAPNPIPAPSAGIPTHFEVRWQVRNKGYEISVGTSDGYFAASCLDCNKQLVTVSCTSSISPADPSARELSCISNDTQVSLGNSFQPYPVGKRDWYFNAHARPGDIALPDKAVVSVELQ
jgi:hypothetical protein